MTESVIITCPCVLQRRCWWVQLADAFFSFWPPGVANFLIIPSYHPIWMSTTTHSTVQICFSVPDLSLPLHHHFSQNQARFHWERLWLKLRSAQKTKITVSSERPSRCSDLASRIWEALNRACDKSTQSRNLSSISGWSTTQWHNLQALQWHCLHLE